LPSHILIKDGKLFVSNFGIEDEEIIDYFKDVKPENIENRFVSSLKVGVLALKTIGTTERIDYIEKRFNNLNFKFTEILKETSDDLSQKFTDIFGENGTLPNVLEENFGENGKVNSLMAAHLGEKGTVSEMIEKYFGKDGLIVKELFDPMKEGTPINQLKNLITDELNRLGQTIGIEEALREQKQRTALKGAEFEDVLEALLGDIVKIHMGDDLTRTSDVVGAVTNSKKGDFVIDIDSKAEYRIVIEAKDWDNIALPKIHKEIDEALENRAAKFGIFVTKWIEALPNSVGCFNCYNNDRIVCGLGSRGDEIIHQEILHVAYCWARTQLLKKSPRAEKIDFEMIDSNLEEIRKQLTSFNNVKTQCRNIDNASKKITQECENIKDEIHQCLQNIKGELEKEVES
jgi:hypothetical protein